MVQPTQQSSSRKLITFDVLFRDTEKFKNINLKEFIFAQLSAGTKKSEKVFSEFHQGILDTDTLADEISETKESLFSDRMLTIFESAPEIEIAKKICSSAQQILNASLASHLEQRIYLQHIEKHIQQKNFGEAYANFKLLRFEFNINEQVIKKLYCILHDLLPELTASQFCDLEKNTVPYLLQASSAFAEQQKQLAVDLAEWHRSYAESINVEKRIETITVAINYYAQAIQIAESHRLSSLNEIHKAASKLLMQVMCDIIDKNNFEANLDQARRGINNFEKFEIHFNKIELLRKYCSDDTDVTNIKTLYANARDVCNAIDNPNEDFQVFSPLIRNGLVNETLPLQFITQTYSRGLAEFRKNFEIEFRIISDNVINSDDVKRFQKNITEKFRAFLLQTFFSDNFAIFGLVKRSYDVRGLGSFAREELCPYSDIEWLILIGEETDKEKFLKWAKLVELQIKSLGETPTNNLPVFSSIGNNYKSGLHIDGNIICDSIDTPAKLVACQSGQELLANSPENMALTSRSILQTDPELFKSYQQECKKILPETRRHQRALHRIKERLTQFKKNWKTPIHELKTIHLKNQYVEPLNYLIGDIRLYFGIEATNTFEVIDNLIERKFFKPESGKLLKEAAAAIYMIRVRLQLGSKEQTETVSLRSLAAENINNNNNNLKRNFHLKEEEIKALINAYWIVLVPLYAYFEDKLINQEVALSNLTSIDLYELSFEQIFTSTNLSNFVTPALEAFVSSLADTDAPTETHFYYYEKLSNKHDREAHRKVYVTTLETFPNQGNTLKRLYHHPNPYGIRQSESKARKELSEQMEKATTREKIFGKNGYSVFMEGPALKAARYLKKNVVDLLLDKNGDIRKDHDNCTNRVAFLESDICECNLHFKQQPPYSSQYSFYPGKEQAVSRLMMRLFGHGVSVSELMKFTVTNDKKQKTYLVLVSLTVKGKNLNDVGTRELVELDQKRLSELFLSVPLILPGDAREANYIFTSTKNEKNQRIQQLVSIDNDIAWVKAMIRQNRSRFSIHLFDVLFLKFPDMVLHPESIRDFLLLKPGPLLHSWFNSLTVWNNVARSQFQEFEKLSEGFTPVCLFEKGTGVQLLAQFFSLQAYLRKHQNRKILADEVLNTIITMENDDFVEVGELIYAEYQKAKQLKGTPSEKLKEITGRSGKASLSMTQSQAVMYQKVPTKDEEKQLCLPEEARKEVEQLVSLNFENVYFLQDENHANLEKAFDKLEAGEKPDLPTQKALLQGLMLHRYVKLNLSNCAALTDSILKKFLEKSASTLKYLDLRNCDQLTDDCLMEIQKCANLEELYISHNKRIEWFEAKHIIKLFKATKFLIFPNLKILHISDCELLKEIRLKAPRLSMLKADKNQKLKKVVIESSQRLETNFTESPNVDPEIIINNGAKGKEIIIGLHDEDKPVSVVTLKKKVPGNPQIPGKQVDSLEESLLMRIKENNPDILQNIKLFVDNHNDKDNNNNNHHTIFDYIKTLIPDTIREDANQLSLSEKSGNNQNAGLKSFYQYLLDKSQSYSEKEIVENNVQARHLDALFDNRPLFIADTEDYSPKVFKKELVASPVLIDEDNNNQVISEIDHSIAKILSYINSAQQSIDRIRHRHVISIIGNTGTGKSTTVNYLFGCRMSMAGRNIIAEEPVAIIGHTPESETCIPMGFSLPNSDIALCDMPGFLETRGSEINIANAVNTRNLLAKAKSNRIFFLINYYSLLGDRADGLKNAIKILVKFFGTIEKLNQNTASILIGVTHFVDLPNNDWPWVKNFIQEIAEKEKWVLRDLDKIIPIDPIKNKAPSKEEILAELTALPIIEGSKDLYSTALRDADLLLIRDISKKISEKINQYWKDWNINGIIEEYHHLSSLLCIQHPSIIEVIQELQEEILKHVMTIASDIQTIAPMDMPAMRHETKDKMRKLDECCPLDTCFEPEKDRITQEVLLVKKELKITEKGMQKKINARIQDDLSLFIQKLTSALNRLLKEQRSHFAAVDITQYNLLESLKQFNLGEIEDIQFLFDQIDLETKLRPQKYYFGDLLPLNELKQKKENEIRDVIIKMHKLARISELGNSFNLAYDSLFINIEGIVQRNSEPLSKKLLAQHELHLLSQYGFNSSHLQKITSAMFELRSLIENSLYRTYEERIEKFLKKIYENAAELHKRKRIEFLSQSINHQLNHELNSDNLIQLNKHFEELSNLDKDAFEKACKWAREALVEKPDKDLQRFLLHIDGNYRFNIKAVFERVNCIKQLPACYKSEKEVAAILKRFEHDVEVHEGKRREAEIHHYKTTIPQLFEGAKALIKDFTIKNFEAISNLALSPKKVETCLGNFSNSLRNLSAFCQTRAELNKAIQTQGQRYYSLDLTKQNDPLSNLADNLETALFHFFDFVATLSKLLTIQKQIDSLLIELEKEAHRLIGNNPQKIIDHALSFEAGFSRKVEELYKHQSTSVQIAKQFTKSAEIQDIETAIGKKIEEFILRTTKDARRKQVEALAQRLQDASLKRTFLEIIDEIPGMLSTLQTQSPEEYSNAKKSLSTALIAWQDSNDLDNCLEAENYTSVAKTFVVLEKLQHTLSQHIKIDAAETMNKISQHILKLFKQALTEIRSDELALTQLKHFLDVLRTFESQNMGLNINEEALEVEAEKRWQELINNVNIRSPQHPIDSILSDNNNVPSVLPTDGLDPVFTKLAKQLIKQYGVATELSMLDEFKPIMRQILEKISPQELVYKFGLKVAEFIIDDFDDERTLDEDLLFSNDFPIKAYAQGIIDTFPEFKRINIEWFNKKAGGIKFSTALERLTCKPEFDVSSKNQLQAAYDIFYKNYSEFLDQIVKKQFDSVKCISDTLILCDKIKSRATSLSAYPKITGHLLAHIFAQWTYLDSKNGFFGDLNSLLQPHSTQLLSILRLIAIDDPEGVKNHLAQIKTGEGKSISLGIISLLFALLGYDVWVCCYSSYLSDRDRKTFKKLFNEFCVKPQITYCTINDLVNSILGKSLPDFRNIVLNFLKGKKAIPFKPQQKDKKLLLIDEVDVFFGSNFYGRNYYPAISVNSLDTEELMRHIWDNKSELRSWLDKDKNTEDLMKLPSSQNILKEYPNLASILPDQIKSMLTALSWFPDSGVTTLKSYVVKNDKIGYVDKAGNLNFSIYDYTTAFAYLYHYEKGEINSDRDLKEHLGINITCAHILYSELPKFFSLKLGLTATLDGLSEEENGVLDAYNFTRRSFVPSTFEKKVLIEEETIVITGEKKDQFEAIRKEMEVKIKEGRACLVFFKNTKKTDEFNDYLKNLQRNDAKFVLPELLTEMVPNKEKTAIISRSTFQYKNTLATRKYGRGIDFICRDEKLVENGGVFIILTFQPSTLIEEIQIKGRTNRQDDPGSIKKILWAEDLLKQGFVPEKINKNGKKVPDLEEFYNSQKSPDQSPDELFNHPLESAPAKQTWDTYLAKKREIKSAAKFEKINKNLAASTEKHKKSLDLAKAIKNGNTKLVLQLLKAIN